MVFCVLGPVDGRIDWRGERSGANNGKWDGRRRGNGLLEGRDAGEIRNHSEREGVWPIEKMDGGDGAGLKGERRDVR